MFLFGLLILSICFLVVQKYFAPKTKRFFWDGMAIGMVFMLGHLFFTGRVSELQNNPYKTLAFVAVSSCIFIFRRR